MSKMKWSKYIRGLGCQNGIALFHHAITGRTIISTDALFDFIEDDNNILDLPVEVKNQLTACNFIVEDIVEDDEIFNTYKEEKIQLANSGQLVDYYNITGRINEKNLKEFCQNVLQANNKFDGFIILDYDDSLLEILDIFVGKIKFIVKLNLSKIDNEILKIAAEFKLKNIGLSININNESKDKINLLNKIVSEDDSYVVDFEFNSIGQLKDYRELLCKYNINLRYIGKEKTQEELIKIYDYIEKLRLINKDINVNWEIPLKNMLFGDKAYFTMKIENVEDYSNLSKESIILIHSVMKNIDKCNECGIEAMCRHKFLRYKESDNNSLCFLSKYSIIKYINNNLGSE